MNIEDAFDGDTIRDANVALDDEDTEVLERILKHTLDQIDGPREDQAINLAGLAFVAGRCYQLDESQQGIVISMSPTLASIFMEFMAERMVR